MDNGVHLNKNDESKGGNDNDYDDCYDKSILMLRNLIVHHYQEGNAYEYVIIL